MSIDQTLFNNMSNSELINHIGWSAPPLVQCLADRLETAEAALHAHEELFETIGRLDNAIDSLDAIYITLEPIGVAESDESAFTTQVRTLAEVIADIRKFCDEMEMVE